MENSAVREGFNDGPSSKVSDALTAVESVAESEMESDIVGESEGDPASEGSAISEEVLANDDTYVLLSGSALSILMFLIISLNIFVLIAIIRYRLFTKPSNMFAMFLALSDLGIGMFVVSGDLTGIFVHDERMGKLLCKGCLYYSQANILCKISITVAIALYRYYYTFGTIRPFKAHTRMSYKQKDMTVRSSLLCCLVITVTSFVLAIYVPIIYDLIEDSSPDGDATVLCTVLFTFRDEYRNIVIAEIVALFLIPMFIILTVTFTIGNKLDVPVQPPASAPSTTSISSQSHPQSISSQSHPQSISSQSHPQSISSQPHPQSISSQSHPQSISSQPHPQSVIRMMLCLAALYFACNVPRQIFRFYLYVYPAETFPLVNVAFLVFNGLTYTNSWLNVVVYVSYNRQLRAALELLGRNVIKQV